MRRIMSLLALLTMLLPASAASSSWTVERPPRLRALLIGCDHFLTQEDTWPAADHNLQMMADALQGDSRRYALIRSASSSVSSLEGLAQLIGATFQNTRVQDVSLLYFSTHGLPGSDGEPSSLLLSDGEKECALTAEDLEGLLEKIPGKKILILDACNSGAFIGKGLSEKAEHIRFQREDSLVLCSAGGSEASWYWQGQGSDDVNGASYFAEVLTSGLGSGGDPAADMNRDGQITLGEMYGFLLDNYAASTPQVYPQDGGDFVLYAYDPAALRPVRKAVTDLTFEDTLLTAGESEVTFSFTVQRQVELYYQIIYHENGAWQFSSAQHYLDGEQADGTVLPGRKERTLTLNTAGEAYGYAIIQLATRENGSIVYQGSRLLCVRPEKGGLDLFVEAEETFSPDQGQEMPIRIYHDVPCGLTVSIQDEMGRTVRRLCFEAPTRPQQLTPNASLYYWDGKNRSGENAQPGRYRAVVQTEIGGEIYQAKSGFFVLSSDDD